MMPRPSTLLLGLLGAVGYSSACTIPTEPLPNTITEPFSIYVQNNTIPRVHNYVMNFRANGDDEHLVLRPDGVETGDTMWLDNGLIRFEEIHAVIDLEYNPGDDTTKLFMTSRLYHPAAIFQPVYGCDPDTDELQIQLELVSRQLDPPVLGGRIGIRETVGTYEFRYTPPNNPLLDHFFLPVNMVIFRGGVSPTPITTVPTPTPTSTATGTATTTPLPTETPGPIGDYEFVSCWAEPADGRALTAKSTAADDMTNEQCATFCATYPYFGTQWSRECFCGTTPAPGSEAAPLSDCSYPCTGDATQRCGGSRRLSLYHNAILTGPSHPATVGDYEFYGCVTDAVGARTLSERTTSSSAMTLEMCSTFCDGYTFFGTEYSVECFCGNALATGATTVPTSDCSMTCSGNANNLCGNGDRLSVYRLPAQ
ncbi:hypothetical protein FQN57_001746 [Myotisia sp. PD_48]|nr:hypothetical protein FQN57_001746 [Myotisia sp. PD_48]